MLKIKKISIFLCLICISTFISCEKNINNENDVVNKELEYLGYEFLDDKINIYSKNFDTTLHLIQVNSLDPIETKQDENIYVMTFTNNNNENASLKVKKEDQLISILLINPKKEFTQRRINQQFDIKINETVYIEETSAIIKLIDVAEDSRCPDPEDNSDSFSNPGSCIHKPKTFIHLSISTPKFPKFDDFFYKEQLSDYKFFYGGNYFSITGIKPEILELNRRIPKAEYNLTITVTTN